MFHSGPSGRIDPFRSRLQPHPRACAQNAQGRLVLLDPSGTRLCQASGVRQLAGLAAGGDDADDVVSLGRELGQAARVRERLIVRMCMNDQHRRHPVTVTGRSSRGICRHSRPRLLAGGALARVDRLVSGLSGLRRLSATQAAETSLSRSETAFAIEPRQVRLVVDVQPLAASLGHAFAEPSDQLLSDAAALDMWRYGGVENEGVLAAVPTCVDEPHKLLIEVSAHPCHTVPSKTCFPWDDLARFVP
jgi:hypothetical protein